MHVDLIIISLESTSTGYTGLRTLDSEANLPGPMNSLSSAQRSLDFFFSSEVNQTYPYPRMPFLVTWALPPIAAAGSRAGTRIRVYRRRVRVASGAVRETWNRALAFGQSHDLYVQICFHPRLSMLAAVLHYDQRGGVIGMSRYRL